MSADEAEFISECGIDGYCTSQEASVLFGEPPRTGAYLAWMLRVCGARPVHVGSKTLWHLAEVKFVAKVCKRVKRVLRKQSGAPSASARG